MTATTWAILGVASGIGALWVVIVAREFVRLRRMQRETAARLAAATPARGRSPSLWSDTDAERELDDDPDAGCGGSSRAPQ